MNPTIITRAVVCVALLLLSTAWPASTRGEQSVQTAGASFAEWEQQIATATSAEHVTTRRRFAAVRNRLVRDERVPQVLRLPLSGEAFRAACATEESQGGGLGVEIWQASGDEVIAAVPPASRRRLARAGIASEVLFESVAVAVDDLITLLNIVLGTAQPPACLNGLPIGGDVDVAVIIQGVNNVLNGCEVT